MWVLNRIHIYTHTHIHTLTHIRTLTHTHTHVHMHTCMHARTHTHTHARGTHTHTRAHTYTPERERLLRLTEKEAEVPEHHWDPSLEDSQPETKNWYTVGAYTLTRLWRSYVTIHLQIGHNVQNAKIACFCSIITLELQWVQSPFFVYKLQNGRSISKPRTKLPASSICELQHFKFQQKSARFHPLMVNRVDSHAYSL